MTDKPTNCPWCGIKPVSVADVQDGWGCGSFPRGEKPWQSDACRVRELEQKVEALRKALEDLIEVQNGPPLIKWEKAWGEAMEKAAAALAGTPAEGESE